MRWIFKTYVKRLVGGYFNEFIYNDIAVDKNKSVLLIANHFSFWDGLILFYLNDKLLKKNFHVMILQETAQKTGMLRYGGAFSVNKNSRDVLLSLDYAAGLLKNPGNLVLMFPQGKLFSNFVSHIHFEQGILKLVQKARGSFQMVFAASFVQFFKHKKPSATVYLKVADDTANTLDELQKNYQQHYDACKLLQTEIDIA